jgi:hypothetical protein
VQGSEKMEGKRDQEPAKNNDHCELWFNKITGGQAPWQAIHGYEKFSLKSYGPERPAKKSHPSRHLLSPAARTG